MWQRYKMNWGRWGLNLREIGEDLYEVSRSSREKDIDFFQKSSRSTAPLYVFETYKDHRMAMAFAPVALFQEVEFVDPTVVKKSYPNFWKDLESLGFETA